MIESFKRMTGPYFWVFLFCLVIGGSLQNAGLLWTGAVVQMIGFSCFAREIRKRIRPMDGRDSEHATR